jgi:hypothetical protein
MAQRLGYPYIQGGNGMLKRILVLSVIALFVLAILSPLLGVSTAANAAPQISTTVRFRVVIAANLSTSLDVYVDGVISAESGLKAVKPLDASGYIAAPGGTHTITLDQTGTTTAVGTPFSFNFTAGSDTSVILLADMTWMTLPDMNVAPLPLQANARLVNLSASTNPVSLSVDAVVPPAFTGVAYKATSASYLAYPVGLHTLAIPGSAARAVSYNFQDGHVNSIFIFWNPAKNLPIIIAKSDTTFIKATPTPTLGLGTPSPTPTLPIVSATNTPRPTPTGNTNASFRLVNASPAGPNVDVLVDNIATKLTNLAFTKASSYIPVSGSAAGTPHTISVVQTGTTSPVLATLSANFVSQVDQTLIFLPGSTTLTALTDQNINPLVGGNPSLVNVRFVNLSLDNQAMDLWVDHSLSTSYSNIPFKGASPYFALDLFPHTLELHQAGNPNMLIPAINAQLLSERVYTVFVFGSAASASPTLQLVVKTDATFLIKTFLPSIRN